MCTSFHVLLINTGVGDCITHNSINNTYNNNRLVIMTTKLKNKHNVLYNMEWGFLEYIMVQSYLIII